MSRVVWIAVPVLCLGFVAGCTSSDPEPDSPSTHSPVAASRSTTPTPSPTPTSEVQDLSSTKLGIVFHDVPDLTGVEADVYNTLAAAQTEYWRTMTTNTVSPAFAVIASSEVQDEMKQIVATNTTSKVSLGGVFNTTVSGITVTGGTAKGVMCDDYHQMTVKDPNGSYSPADVGFGTPRHVSVTLVHLPDEDRWKLQESVVKGSC